MNNFVNIIDPFENSTNSRTKLKKRDNLENSTNSRTKLKKCDNLKDQFDTLFKKYHTERYGFSLFLYPKNIMLKLNSSKKKKEGIFFNLY